MNERNMAEYAEIKVSWNFMHCSLLLFRTFYFDFLLVEHQLCLVEAWRHIFKNHLMWNTNFCMSSIMEWIYHKILLKFLTNFIAILVKWPMHTFDSNQNNNTSKHLNCSLKKKFLIWWKSQSKTRWWRLYSSIGNS